MLISKDLSTKFLIFFTICHKSFYPCDVVSQGCSRLQLRFKRMKSISELFTFTFVNSKRKQALLRSNLPAIELIPVLYIYIVIVSSSNGTAFFSIDNIQGVDMAQKTFSDLYASFESLSGSLSVISPNSLVLYISKQSIHSLICRSQTL